MDSEEKKFRIWEIVSRGFAPALITVAIAGATLFANSKFQDAELERKKQESVTQKALAALQMSITQKNEESTIGLRIVENLMEKFNEKGQGPANTQEELAEKLLFLRLTALNFQDVALNLKPFFENIDEKLQCDADERALREAVERKGRREPLSETDLCVLHKEELRDIGRELARRQAYMLSLTGGFLSDPFEVTEVDPDPKTVDGFSIRGSEVKIEAKEIEEDSIEVKIFIGPNEFGPLTVSYFDAPLVDNVLQSEFRWSVLLKKTNPKAQPARAEVQLLHFFPYLASDRIELLDRSRAGFVLPPTQFPP